MQGVAHELMPQDYIDKCMQMYVENVEQIEKRRTSERPARNLGGFVFSELRRNLRPAWLLLLLRRTLRA